jgi:hypothetical protein
MKPIAAQWCQSDNLGDKLMPWLVSKVAGQWPWYTATGPRWLLGGSILNWADADCYVWGAGLADRKHKVNPAAKLLAVRGPESAKIAVACGYSSSSAFAREFRDAFGMSATEFRRGGAAAARKIRQIHIAEIGER